MINPSVLRLGRHFAICVLLVIGPSLWLAPPTVVSLDAQRLTVLMGSVLAYLLALFLLRGGTSPRNTRDLLVAFAASFGLWVGAVVLWESGLLGTALPLYNRAALFTGLAVGLAGLQLTARTRAESWPALVAIALAGLIALAGHEAFHEKWLPRPVGPQREVRRLDTNAYQIKLTNYDGWIPMHWRRGDGTIRRGGGIAPWGTRHIIATGEGGLFLVAEDAAAGRLEVTELPYVVPLEAEQFEKGGAEIFSKEPNPAVESYSFRVTGILVQELGESRRILATHYHWNDAGKCFVLRLSALEGTPAQFESTPLALQWRTVFDTSPCLPLNTTNPLIDRFDGYESGGRLVDLGDGKVLLSVGDNSFDGLTRPGRLAQDPAASYGKILRIDVATGEATTFSMGHRNPQGLHLAASGVLWETEHGPRGGDEINRIVAGKDYGWPTVTYGTEYSRRHWSLNPHPQHHEGFEPPVFTFVPSIGISALTTGTSSLFPDWKDDLLIGTMKAGAVYRAHLVDGNIVFVEPIVVGERIRDLTFGSDGRLILWTDAGKVMFLEPAESDKGEELAAQCTQCHGMSLWDPPSTRGPNLSGVVDRAVASVADFPYSPAMKSHGGVWTRARLDAFLANPQKAVPGTSMLFPGVSDPVQRQLLIEYLANPAPPP